MLTPEKKKEIVQSAVDALERRMGDYASLSKMDAIKTAYVDGIIWLAQFLTEDMLK